MKISIVICTHNRADLLQDAVQSVLVQDFPRDLYELIIIDNGSTDNSRQMAEEFITRYPNIRYIFEPEIGLSHARNRGWQEARGEYIGFLDDDCRVPFEWLEVAAEIAGQKAPAAFGGPYFAFYNTAKPKWFRDNYGSHIQGTMARPLGANEFLDGGNLFIRRNLLIKFGGFDARFGMKGNIVAYGEETDLIEKIRHQKDDNILYYEPRLFINHLVDAKKMTWRWIIRQRIAGGRDHYHLFKEPGNTGVTMTFLRFIKNICLLCMDFIIAPFARDRKKYPFKENYVYEHTLTYLVNTSSLWEQIKELFKKD